MPAKDEVKLAPERLGLSTKDIIYLIVFRELSSDKGYLSDMYQVVRTELSALEKGKGRSYYYQVVNEMERFGWISLQGTIGKKKIYELSESGREKIETFRSTYHESISLLNQMADYLLFVITGSGSSRAPSLSSEQLKLFNRLINVRFLTRYLILRILSDRSHQSETAIDILQLIRDTYHWQCAEGYIYELLHEMEDGEHEWVYGQWQDERRRYYYYRITDQGSMALSQEEESALMFIRNLKNYTGLMLKLFK
ncbi:helix-turn-helix transcriptional regulator [Paenibacillus sp. FSL L8-0709]|uniref:helix-turn-helix transcriptional regulator n=1 Tax=Paenibacillus sp. FSL L8-0709 TaxID=2975312 RepID=UPI0030F65B74